MVLLYWVQEICFWGAERIRLAGGIGSHVSVPQGGALGFAFFGDSARVPRSILKWSLARNVFAEISTAQVRSVSVFGALYVLCGRVQGFRHFFYLPGRRSILCTLLRRWQAWVWEVLEVFFMRGAIFGATFGELWRCFQMTFTSTVLIRTPRLHFVGGKRHNFHKRCWQLKSCDVQRCFGRRSRCGAVLVVRVGSFHRNAHFDIARATLSSFCAGRMGLVVVQCLIILISCATPSASCAGVFPLRKGAHLRSCMKLV